jgi:hypothetical protein
MKAAIVNNISEIKFSPHKLFKKETDKDNNLHSLLDLGIESNILFDLLIIDNKRK